MAKKQGNIVYKFGLVGRHIEYSFSRHFFNEKFKNEGLPYYYQNFDLEDLSGFRAVLEQNSDLKGLNVTIPYKESIIPYMDRLSKTAKRIGAVNTIKFTKKGNLKGYNTDAFGFKNSLKPLLSKHHQSALILGTGGASKAIVYVLIKLGLSFNYVSRSKRDNGFTYDELTAEIIKTHQIIINCTPLGTFPNVDECPNLPYEHLDTRHLLFDLIYNPSMTEFMNRGASQGAQVSNGKKMLELQAEKAWSIWMT
ncbi:MAG: shikimate dehydrogenase [Bacteroidia bacterium]|nr:shikimate dehydrogenase [Bacteroidia bacterium]NNK74022.1 shikimate dehydrogenase [Flavobacteriaceae bacterium]